ncbi:MAG: threonine ammonia-lyase IlvA [Flavobacteriaceae bacterium]|nr:threonine ammonia-lyase IlvA [Flavobacteriaceae bacterium]
MKIIVLVSLEKVKLALNNLNNITLSTPLELIDSYSNLYSSNVYVKREDLQITRSFKIRGSFNKILSLSDKQKENGIVCSSAGNHAQGVSFSCNKLKINGIIFIPNTTPNIKVKKVKEFGGKYVKVKLIGDSYDDCYKQALAYCKKNNKTFIHPFDDNKIIEGQATLAYEIFQELSDTIDYMFIPIGGGGLVSGFISVFKQLSPKTKIIGVEPSGAASMDISIKNNKLTELKEIDTFVDGAAVKKSGKIAFNLCKEYLDGIILVPEGYICQTILDMYNNEGIIAEPAGAMSLASLKFYKDKIKNKKVLCLVCGGNNDITRMGIIKERALLYSNLKHYFIIKFPQRAGALKDFVTNILGPNDDITFFEYSKKTNKENGPAVVGIQLKDENDLQPLINRMKNNNFYSDYINNNESLFNFLI